MPDHYRRAAVLLALAALALAALACNSETSVVPTATPPPTEVQSELEGGVYLALGDSIAAGTGASDADSTGYVALVAEALQSRFGPTLELRSLAEGGDTTEDLIDKLSQAVELLEQGDVRVVTVTIGGNDLFQYSSSPVCIDAPADPACPLRDGLLGVAERLNRILGELRAASSLTDIVIQLYPNLFSGTGELNFSGIIIREGAPEVAFGLLNDVIAEAAGRNGVLIADPRAGFDGRGGDLGHLLDPEPDAHPNDDGHRLIADAFLAALGLSTVD